MWGWSVVKAFMEGSGREEAEGVEVEVISPCVFDPGGKLVPGFWAEFEASPEVREERLWGARDE